jgi:hypothetical protein
MEMLGKLSASRQGVPEGRRDSSACAPSLVQENPRAIALQTISNKYFSINDLRQYFVQNQRIFRIRLVD